ncbi:MAG: peptidylprolyl isomerase [Rhodocyclaceae bacterium]|jgi:peptidyl-prolyl cis-trans isomerase C|nr:peptidylprolyl isomerase [Rhodocyclaceae bacterium]MDP3038070.1 peptidylprolyl isomerase [Rhodocyclaceae bacterium]
MKRALLTASLFAFSAAFAATSFAQTAAKEATAGVARPVATVNGKAIPVSRADLLIAGQIAQGQANTPELQAAVREELVRREILSQEATKKGVGKKVEVQNQLELARQGVLIGAYLNDFAAALKFSDADVKKEYETIRATLGEKEYKARHILVDNETDAMSIIDKLKKGEKFDDLAKVSKDPGSKERGGDLGWANKATYVPAFSDALVKLEKGKYTQAPVQSNFGWHVIQLDDMRELNAPAFDEVKPQIIQGMRQRAVEKHILELRGKAKVE